MARFLLGFLGFERKLLLLQGRSAQRVETAFKAMTQRIRAAQSAHRETFLVVYYSGHADVGDAPRSHPIVVRPADDSAAKRGRRSRF